MAQGRVYRTQPIPPNRIRDLDKAAQALVKFITGDLSAADVRAAREQLVAAYNTGCADTRNKLDDASQP